MKLYIRLLEVIISMFGSQEMRMLAKLAKAEPLVLIKSMDPSWEKAELIAIATVQKGHGKMEAFRAYIDVLEGAGIKYERNELLSKVSEILAEHTAEDRLSNSSGEPNSR